MGHQPSLVLCPRLHAGQRACALPAGGVGLAGVPFAGAVEITCTLEAESVSAWGGPRCGCRVPAL